MKRIFKILAVTAAAALALLAFAACEHRLDSSSKAEAASAAESKSAESIADAALDKSQSFVIALYPEYAPITCENFEKLVSEGFYDGLYFHRIYKGFMAQGGDGSVAGRAAETIKGEFSQNGVKNDLSHTRGVVSMARNQVMDSASSQFFIVYDDSAKASLDGLYAGFGKVTEGMEVVDSFLNIPMTMGKDKIPTSPTEPIQILKAVIDGKDADGHTLCRFYMQVGSK